VACFLLHSVYSWSSATDVTLLRAAFLGLNSVAGKPDQGGKSHSASILRA